MIAIIDGSAIDGECKKNQRLQYRFGGGSFW